jgi:hypothetical protein
MEGVNMPGILSEAIAAQYPLIRERFERQQVAASLTNSQLNLVETRAASSTLNVQGIVMPYDGSVFAIAASFSGNVTAGSFTAMLSVNGTAKATCVVVITTGSKGYAIFEAGQFPFSAGDVVGVQITTNGSYAPTTLDLAVDLYIVPGPVYY